VRARRRTILVALGGNALTAAGQRGTYAEQRENAGRVAGMLAELRLAGHRLVVTHGNGPQVGALELQQAAATDEVPPLPLHALGAMTQGFLGYVLVDALGERLPDTPVAALVTRVEVDPDDPAFEHPSKPIGPFYSGREAEELRSERGWKLVEDAGRGWRRVVPSPEPVRIVEGETIATLVERGVVLVAAGGGGIPVVAREGRLVGVNAVIDKDRSAAVLASTVQADLLLMLTGVPRIAIGFGTDEQRELERLSAVDARRYLAEGQFPAGSMGPKVEAALRFVENGGEAAIVADFDHAADAVAGRHGTRIVA
jgi:carbamate kinase